MISELVTRRVLVMTHEAGARLTEPSAVAEALSAEALPEFFVMITRAYAQVHAPDPPRGGPGP